MNRNQILLLVGLGVILGGLGYYFTSSRRASFDTGRDVREGQKLLGNFPVNDVVRVVLRSRDGDVTLYRTNGLWVVADRAGYPAAFTQVADLLRKLWDLRAVQTQQVGQSQWGRLDLLAPVKDGPTNSATLIELLDKEGRPVRSLLLGKQQMRDTGGQFGGFPVGRWLALPDNKENVFVTSESFSEVEPKPENWLNKDFFKVEKLVGIQLVSTNADASWSLLRTNDAAEWTLADARSGEQLDNAKVSGLNWAFSSPSFTDVHAKDDAAVKDAFAAPTVLQLATADGFRYELKVGAQPDADSYWLAVAAAAELPAQRAAPADEAPEAKEAAEKAWKEAQDKLKAKLKQEQALAGWVFKSPKWTVDSVLKDRSALLATNTPAAAVDIPAEVIPPLRPAGEAPEK
ncbi:MAG: DUF4340 domain-containing protein [Limisphaerales bacterium]